MAVSHTTDSTFEQDVLASPIPVLVDFWAEWCGPCRMIAPILDEVAAASNGEIKIVKLNIDENPTIPSQLGVRSIPTLVLFKDGKVFSSKVGVLPKSKILEWVQTALAK